MALLKSAEAIGAEIATRLEQRTIALGAETDIGRKVYRGRTAIDEDQIPCCVVIEGADEVTEGEGRVSTKVEVQQQYVVLAYLACDDENPNDAAHAAIRDVKRALFTTAGRPDRTLNEQVARVRYRGRDIGPRADGAAFVVAAVEVTATYIEDLSNP